jgi:hypothetical protein
MPGSRPRARTRFSRLTPQIPTFSAAKLDAAAEGPVIDGRVNDAIWQSVQPYTSFTQQDPIEGAPASEKTEVRVIVGKGTIYVGIIAFDSDPSKIIVSQARRDASLNDTDSVVMVFDTFNDTRTPSCSAPIRSASSTTARSRAKGRRAAFARRGGGGAPARSAAASARSIPNWDGDWTVQVADHRARLGSRNGDPVEDAALPDRREPDVGLQPAEEHPP